MIKIRSNLKSSIEFSVKKKAGNVSETLTIKIERSNVKGKPEFLNEITEDECKALKDDSSGIFKTLIKDGDFQIVQDEEAQEDSENKAFSMEELEAHSISELKAYKEGEGAELLQSSLDEAKKERTVWESEVTTKNEEVVKKAVNEVRTNLIKKHNAEIAKDKPKKWSE